MTQMCPANSTIVPFKSKCTAAEVIFATPIHTKLSTKLIGVKTFSI